MHKDTGTVDPKHIQHFDAAVSICSYVLWQEIKATPTTRTTEKDPNHYRSGMFHRGDCESRVIPAAGGGSSDLPMDVSKILKGAFVRPRDIRPFFNSPT